MLIRPPRHLVMPDAVVLTRKVVATCCDGKDPFCRECIQRSIGTLPAKKAKRVKA